MELTVSEVSTKMPLIIQILTKVFESIYKVIKYFFNCKLNKVMIIPQEQCHLNSFVSHDTILHV